jgi:hypothetical protein
MRTLLEIRGLWKQAQQYTWKSLGPKQRKEAVGDAHHLKGLIFNPNRNGICMPIGLGPILGHTITISLYIIE